VLLTHKIGNTQLSANLKLKSNSSFTHLRNSVFFKPYEELCNLSIDQDSFRNSYTLRSTLFVCPDAVTDLDTQMMMTMRRIKMMRIAPAMIPIIRMLDSKKELGLLKGISPWPVNRVITHA